MSYDNTTVKGELIKLNDEVVQLLDQAEGSHEISEHTLDALNNLSSDIQDTLYDNRMVREYEIAESRGILVDLRRDVLAASKNVKDGLSDLGDDVVAGLVGGASVLVGGAVVSGMLGLLGVVVKAAVDLRIQRENDPESIFERKKIRALAVLRENQPIELERYMEKLLFEGFSEHDAKYVPLGLIDRSQSSSKGKVLLRACG
jgi:hypothetical protein